MRRTMKWQWWCNAVVLFWLPWLRTAACGSCRLKSAAAIHAEDVPVAHHADESSRLRSARVM